MITPGFLQSCTDEQINKGIAWIEIVRLSKMLPGYSANTGDISEGASIGLLRASYCTNPNDAWPIIDRNGITVGPVFTSSNRIKIATCKDFWIRNENGLRAAMEVYILMECSK